MNKIVRYEKTILAETEDDLPRTKTTNLKKSLFHRNSLLGRQRENVFQLDEHQTLNPSSFKLNLTHNDQFEKSKTLDLLFVPDKRPVQIPSKMARLEFSDSEDSGTIKAGTSEDATPSRGILKKESTFNSPKHKSSRKSLILSQLVQLQSIDEASKPRVKRRPPNLVTNLKEKAKESTEEVPSPFLFEKSREQAKIKKEPKTRIYRLLSKFGKSKAKTQAQKIAGDLSKDQHAMLRDNATFTVKPATLNSAQKKRGDSYQFLWKYQSRGPRSRAGTLTEKLKSLLTTNPVTKLRSLKKRLESNLRGPYTPDSKGRLFWEFFIMLMILSEFITIPLSLAFDLDQILTLSVLNVLEDVFFSFDIIIRFNTGFYKKGILILDRKRIASRYLKFWFWIDLLITFPFEAIIPNEDRGFHSSASISNGFSTATLVVRLLKVFRVLRVFRLASIFTKFESYLAVSPAVTSLINFIRLLLINLIIAHWIACLWHFTALLEVGKAPSTWLTSYGIIDRDWKVRYVFSLYWATTTMITVGYGDITPVTTIEKVLAMMTMIVAGGVFANTMNSINEILAGLNNTTQLFSQAMRAIRKYMVKKQIPRELQVKIKKYLEYALNEETSLSVGEKSIYSMLSESLKNELIFEVQGKILFQAKVFRRVFTMDFLKATTILMKEKLYSPEDKICLEDSTEDLAIFFISTGKVEIFSLYSNSHVNDLDRGAYFGEISFFSGQPRASSARAIDFTSIYYIERDEFLSFIAKFPLEKEKFCTIKDLVNVYGNLARLSISCFSCNERGHTARNCPLLHYVVKKEDFINELLRRRKEKAKNFQRRPRNEVLGISRYVKMEDAAIKLMRQISEKNENKSEILSSIGPGYLPFLINQSGKSHPRMEAFGLPSEAEESESHNIFGSRQSISPSIILPPIDSIDITKTPLIKEPSFLDKTETNRRKTVLRISIVKPDEDVESQDSKRADYDYFSEEDESKKIKKKRKDSKGKQHTLSSNQFSRVISRRSLWSQVREMREQSVYQENILKMDRNIHFETDIDMVANFEYYFPHNNVSKLYQGSNYNPDTSQSIADHEEEKQENGV